MVANNLIKFGTRKAEVLNSLIINTTAKANDTTDIDNNCYRNVCKMSVVSFALAVVFIINLIKIVYDRTSITLDDKRPKKG